MKSLLLYLSLAVSLVAQTTIKPTTAENVAAVLPAAITEAGAAEVRDAFANPSRLPAITTLAIMGDSLSANVSGLPTDSASLLAGYTWPILAKLGQRIELIKHSTGTNFQQGGMSAEEIRDTWLPLVVAADPDVCFFMAGNNSLAMARAQSSNLDIAAQWLYSQIEDIMLGLTNAGIKCMVATLTPEAYPTDTAYPPASGTKHPDYRIIRAKVNDLIRLNAKKCGAEVCDWGNLIAVDPTDDLSLADPGYLDANVLAPIHMNYCGYWKIGSYAADRIAQCFVVGPEPAFPASGDASWALLNPTMTGDVSGVATSFSVVTSGTITVTKSKNADGSQRLVCTDGGLPGDRTKSFYLRNYRTITTSAWDNEQFYAVVDLVPQESDWEVWAISLKLACSGNVSGVNRTAEGPGAGNTNILDVIDYNAPFSRRLRLLTPIVQHPGDTGTNQRQITLDLRFYGRGTFDVYTMGVIKL